MALSYAANRGSKGGVGGLREGRVGTQLIATSLTSRAWPRRAPPSPQPRCTRPHERDRAHSEPVRRFRAPLIAVRLARQILSPEDDNFSFKQNKKRASLAHGGEGSLLPEAEVSSGDGGARLDTADEQALAQTGRLPQVYVVQ